MVTWLMCGWGLLALPPAAKPKAEDSEESQRREAANDTPGDDARGNLGLAGFRVRGGCVWGAVGVGARKGGGLGEQGLNFRIVPGRRVLACRLDMVGDYGWGFICARLGAVAALVFPGQGGYVEDVDLVRLGICCVDAIRLRRAVEATYYDHLAFTFGRSGVGVACAGARGAGR
jgi:hypothetical protein